MGQNDEKENVPAGTPTAEVEDPKETEKLLTSERKSESENQNKDHKTDKDEGNKDEEKKVNGEEIIDIPESETKQLKEDGREVKPKKIPIGGIKMPGFFTRNKPKTEGDGAEGELLDNAGNETKAEEQAKEAEANTRPRFLSSLKIRNPFGKKSVEVKTEQQLTIAVPTEPETEKVAEEEPINNPPPKKGLLTAIRLPIANIIPRKLRTSTHADDVELGNGPNNKAGLASMETLDDSIKDTENSKDVTDKAAIVHEDLETVKLTESDKEKEKEKLDEKADLEKEKIPIIDRIRAHRCSVDDLTIIGGIIVFLLLVAIICAFTFTGNPALKAAPLRDGKYIQAVTSCGTVEGLKEDSAYAFRGIPYAEPPIGKNRFRPAQLIDNINSCWNDTVFKAYNATPVCLQTYANGSIDGTENCLHLDVITPHVRYDTPLPVVVLIGAESLSGGSPNKLRPSARFARNRDVIFVRPNFRLGVLGFLAVDILSQSVHPPTSGNYGLSDIIAALKWVQLNIIHFGGNPKAVTLFGHQAGGTLVNALVTSAEAKDLFARAWVASGSTTFPGRLLGDYEQVNKEYLSNIKCDTVECLQTADAVSLLNAVPKHWLKEWPDLPSKSEDPTKRHEWLVLDGKILQKHPWTLPLLGPLKLVVGTTAHESHSSYLLNKHENWTQELVKEHIEDSRLAQLGLVDEIIKRYPLTYQGLVSLISDIRTICPIQSMVGAKEQRIPFYVVRQPGSELNITDVDADIQAILGRYAPKTPEQRRYVSSIQQLFYHYVSHGEMKQYDANRPILEIIQDPLPVKSYENCQFFIKEDVCPRYSRID